MSDVFSIDIKELDGFVKSLNDAPQILHQELDSGARRIAFHGESLSKVYAPVWLGNLVNSIYSRVESGGAMVSAIWGATAEYAAAVDKGRRAGARMPPKGALLAWMAAHGIAEEAEFVVRRAIGEKGIAARPFVTRALSEISRDGFATKELGDAVGRALKRIGGN